MSEWTYLGQPIESLPQDSVGFIYVITNKIDGRKYIGKKKQFFVKTTQKTITLKNGTKKKKKIKTNVQSDWRTYYGSSDELKADVERLGVENFDREILEFANSLSMISYLEAKYQFETDALLHPDKWYNSWIMVRVRRDHLIGKLNKSKETAEN